MIVEEFTGRHEDRAASPPRGRALRARPDPFVERRGRALLQDSHHPLPPAAPSLDGLDSLRRTAKLGAPCCRLALLLDARKLPGAFAAYVNLTLRAYRDPAVMRDEVKAPPGIAVMGEIEEVCAMCSVQSLSLLRGTSVGLEENKKSMAQCFRSHAATIQEPA